MVGCVGINLLLGCVGINLLLVLFCYWYYELVGCAGMIHWLVVLVSLIDWLCRYYQFGVAIINWLVGVAIINWLTGVGVINWLVVVVLSIGWLCWYY